MLSRIPGANFSPPPAPSAEVARGPFAYNGGPDGSPAGRPGGRDINSFDDNQGPGRSGWWPGRGGGDGRGGTAGWMGKGPDAAGRSPSSYQAFSLASPVGPTPDGYQTEDLRSGDQPPRDSGPIWRQPPSGSSGDQGRPGGPRVGPVAAVAWSTTMAGPIANAPDPMQPVAAANGPGIGAVAIVAGRGATPPSQATADREALKTLLAPSADRPAEVPGVAPGGRASASARRGPADVAAPDASTQEGEVVEATAPGPGPLGSGTLAEYLPVDPASVEAALARVLVRFEALGSPFAAPAARTPLFLPVALAVAALEAARRWRARGSVPGPSVARGSRFSSLRGLS